MPALFRSALAGLLVISGAALVSQDKLTIVDESYRMHLLDPRRTTISHSSVKLHLGHVQTNVCLQALTRIGQYSA
jgi:hypothetical protein